MGKIIPSFNLGKGMIKAKVWTPKNAKQSNQLNGFGFLSGAEEIFTTQLHCILLSKSTCHFYSKALVLIFYFKKVILFSKNETYKAQPTNHDIFSIITVLF